MTDYPAKLNQADFVVDTPVVIEIRAMTDMNKPWMWEK